MSIKDQNPLRRMVGAMVVAVVMVFLFVWFFGAALHRPQPHDVPVGIVGPELLKERVVAGAQANAPGAFSFQSLSSAADARSAIEDRDVAGALIIGSGEPQILVAGAGGQAASGVISGTFVSMAKAFGQAPVVEDVQPLPESDTLGLVPFFLVLGVTVSAFVFQLLAREQDKGPTLRAAIMSLLVFAVVTGLVAGLAVGIGVGFAINYWALAGVCVAGFGRRGRHLGMLPAFRPCRCGHRRLGHHSVGQRLVRERHRIPLPSPAVPMVVARSTCWFGA